MRTLRCIPVAHPASRRVGGVVAKLAFFDPQPAKAVPASTSVDIQKMQQSITNLPVQKFQDMTFVFSGD
jgi:hypothetical protein